MRTAGLVLPEQAPSQEEPVPSYLVPQNGAAPKGNWVLDPDSGEFMWVPVDNVGQNLNSRQPVLQTLPEKTTAPILPQRVKWEDEGVAPRQ
jgi:hypothetical protein